MAEQDGLTAAADAILRRDPSVLTLGDCLRDFLRRRTPPFLAAAIAGALALRIALGHWDWHDAAVAVWLLSFPIHAVLGGDRLPHAATGLLVSYLILAAYEWCHFLIHTPYRPKGRYYRSIWRGHRLHHYKNEHYWFGVTSTVGDQMLRTAPEQSTVAKSNTARTLGVDVP